MKNIRSFLNHTPRIAKTAYIDPASTIIGQVMIGEDSSVWPGVSIRGDMHRIEIGAQTSIQDNCVCHITHDSEHHPGGFPLTIGNEVTVGHKAMLHGCTIGDLCIIGIGAIILDGVIIEPETILAAGSIVPPGKILQSGYLYLGSPAIQKRPLTPEERAFLRYSADNYVKLKNQYLAQN